MKKSKTVSREVTEEEVLDSRLNEVRKKLHLFPEPTYVHEVGTEVSVGSLQEATVEEVLEGGKIYKIDYTNYNSNYGHPIYTPHQKIYFPWMNVRKVSKNKDSLIENEDIKLRFTQERIQSLFIRVYDSGVNFEPDYQRDFVWNMAKKVNLIDSIFKNVDIGKFVFIYKGYSEDIYEILDGKQRLRALLDFYEDRFTYNGKYFSDLSSIDQSHFKGYSIPICETEELTEEQVLRYFLYLNTGGEPMAEEHLNKIRERLKKVQERNK